VYKSGVLKSSVVGMSVAQVLDSSSNGLRVTAPCPLPVDTQVQILLDDTQISGSVRNCVLANRTQFHVGIGNVTSASIDPFHGRALQPGSPAGQFSLFDQEDGVEHP